ncbi:hypothetical protein [Nocardia miyunensis]|uniref:hypothetical protein n=1 Tax=Nocardia miyunensis TaxID=282684 RepID=UPI0014720F66|nr:hypothetical protein [Nocardia miyunensis]
MITTLIVLLTMAMITMTAGCGHGHRPGSAPVGTDVHAAPTHLRWSQFQGMSVPIADQGPARDNGSVATGYTRTPAGAALGAIQITIRMSLADDTHYPQIGQLLTAGPGRDAWAIARAQISIPGPIAAGAAPRLLGYRVSTWNPDRVVVAIYTRQTDRSLTANTATVVWTAGDWKLALPDPPDSAPVTAVATTPPDMVALAQP